MKKPSEIFKSGKMSDLTPDHVWVIVSGLYRENLAKAWFIGMGWLEGFHYCESKEYVIKSAAPIMLEKNLRALWFAIPMITHVTARKK